MKNPAILKINQSTSNLIFCFLIMKSLHYIQRHILKKLLFSKGLRYSQVKPKKDLPNNQFDFHLKELIRHKLIVKSDNVYKLTDLGKEYSNRMDDETVQVQKQAKIGAISVALREFNREWEYLVYTRLKHPFYGSQGFPSGKVRWGESISATCKRELKEETNLIGNPELFKVGHHLVYKKNTHELVEDKIFFFHRIFNPKGKLKSNHEGNFEWVKEKDFKIFLRKPFGSVQEILNLAKEAREFSGYLAFYEEKEFTENF